jgi:hypothetical protein
MNYKTSITFTPEQLAMIKAALTDMSLWYDKDSGKIEEHRVSQETIDTVKALAQHIKDMHAVTLQGQGQ